MNTEPVPYFIMDWKTALLRPGAKQMVYLRSLMESRSFLDRVPDQSLIAENYEGANYLVATRGKDYALIYTPSGLNIKVNMGKISGNLVGANWYDPRTGKYVYIGMYENKGVLDFLPPSSGRGEDWILVLDSIK